jgi:hypothetical protein
LQQMKGEGAMLKKKFSTGCANTKVLSVAAPAVEGWNIHNSQAALILHTKRASKYTRSVRLKTVSLAKHNNSERCAARSRGGGGGGSKNRF